MRVTDFGIFGRSETTSNETRTESGGGHVFDALDKSDEVGDRIRVREFDS